MSEELYGKSVEVDPCHFPTECPHYADCANGNLACESFADYVQDGICRAETRGKPTRASYIRIFKGKEV